MITDERKAELLDMFDRTYNSVSLLSHTGALYTADQWCADNDLTPDETVWLANHVMGW